MVLRVPPFCWMVSVCTGRPEAAMACSSLRLFMLSQPSEISSAAPTLGCVVIAVIMRSAYSLG
jgi:hypothetical protein